jgi:hypothetical protein
MKHSDIRRNLSAYLDGSVTSEERKMIGEHLESCRECRVALEELRKTAAYIRDLEEVEPPAWLARKIVEKAREEAEMKKGVFKRLFFPFPVKLSIEAAALVLVTVTGYLVFRVAQPEMELVGTTAREESGKAAPSAVGPSAPHAAAPVEKQVKEERAAGKTEGKAASPKPLERKREPLLREKELPASVPEVEFAPAPEAKSVSPGYEASDMIRKKESSPAPAAQAERSIGASGMADEVKTEMGSGNFVQRKAKAPMVKKVEPNVSFVLRSGKSASLGSDIERLVTRLGGRIVKRERSGENLSINILIDEGKLNILREKLGSFGEVTSRGLNSVSGGGTGETAVSIEIEPE